MLSSAPKPDALVVTITLLGLGTLLTAAMQALFG